MIEKGKRVPNWALTDSDGESFEIWNFRQKNHAVILYDPQASKETISRWKEAIKADQKQWDWLNVKVLVIQKAPEEVLPGAYVIDRYGMFWNYFSPGHWTFDDLEKDLMYYEAKHC